MMNWLSGHWQFNREIHHADGQLNLVDGVASFCPKIQDFLNPYFIYDEVGVLRIGAQEFRAERRYLWREDDGRIFVSFEDGRPFHDFSSPSFDTETAKAAHLCIQDHYQVSYQFSKNHWQSIWQVQGPKKNYKMSTYYVRG